MADQDVRHELDQTKTGVAALGLCIARVLTESDPTTGLRIVEEANKMHKHLAEHHRVAACQILSAFALALASPKQNPLLSPPD